MSDGFWKRRFASDRSILGRQIALGGVQHTIVGVLPPSFRWGAETVDVLVPLAPDPAASRGDRQLHVIGRLAEGVTIGRAQNELAGIAAALAEQYPDADKGWSVRLHVVLRLAHPGLGSRLPGASCSAPSRVLLLIACANVANLLLARAATRQKEFSIRVALGAARWRIVRQLLTESLLLSLVAGVVGLAGGAAATRLLVAYGPASVPRLDETSFDLTVFLFALAVSVTTAFVFGMAPAMQVSRQAPAATLQDATRGSSGGVGRQRMRSALTVLEVALSVVLLIGAGLLLRSVWRLQQVDPGFNASPLMTARVALARLDLSEQQARGALLRTASGRDTGAARHRRGGSYEWRSTGRWQSSYRVSGAGRGTWRRSAGLGRLASGQPGLLRRDGYSTARERLLVARSRESATDNHHQRNDGAAVLAESRPDRADRHFEHVSDVRHFRKPCPDDYRRGG